MPLGNALAVAEDKYNGIVGHLGSQTRARLRSKVTEKPSKGADMNFYDIVGSLEFAEKTGRRAVTAWQEANIFKRRGVFASTADLPIVFDEDDPEILSYNLQSPIFREIVSAANRKYDDWIIAALDASVTELDKSDGNTTPTTVAFDTDYQIGADIGAANSSLNHDKLDAILELFGINEVRDHESGRPVLLVSTREVNQLNREIRNEVAFSGDKAALGALTDIITNGYGMYYGFDFVVSERLGTLGDDRKCFAFYTTGLIYSKGYDARIRMFEDINESDAVKMRGKCRGAGLRLLDDRVIRVLCDADATYNAA